MNQPLLKIEVSSQIESESLDKTKNQLGIRSDFTIISPVLAYFKNDSREEWSLDPSIAAFVNGRIDFWKITLVQPIGKPWFKLRVILHNEENGSIIYPDEFDVKKVSIVNEIPLPQSITE